MNKRAKDIAIAVAGVVLVLILSFGIFTGIRLWVEGRTTSAVAPVEEVKEEEEAVVTPDMSPEAFLAVTNRLRAESGLAPLALDDRLNESAQAKCDDMASNVYYGHKNPTTGKQGYEYALDNFDNVRGYYTENINRGQFYRSAKPSVAGDKMVSLEGRWGYYTTWMASTDGHREAILDPTNTLTGIGFCGNDSRDGNWGQWFAVQHFYSPEYR